MFVFGTITVVSELDDLVEQWREDFVGFLVTRYRAHSENVRMTGVIHARLDDVIDGKSVRC